MVASIELGTVLFTAIEPHRGHEIAYNRWYERSDHFYAGMMAGEHVFAGRRFVATRRLKDLRAPSASPMCPDQMSASYLTVYWILAGKHNEWSRWAVDQVTELHATGRMFDERDHSHTAMYGHVSSAARGPGSTSIELALDRNYSGLVVTSCDLGDGVTKADLEVSQIIWPKIIPMSHRNI